MSESIRKLLGVSLLALGSICMVVMMESAAYAGSAYCSDDGCDARGGSPSTCGSAGGCTKLQSETCTCKTDPQDNTNCYCNAG